MTFGRVRDGFPYLSISLPGVDGSLDVQCILDTGFDGHLILPPIVLHRIECEYIGHLDVVLADRTIRKVPGYTVNLEWLGAQTPVEVLLMDGRPLPGGRAVEGNLAQIEMQSDGEAVVEQ